MLHHNMIGWTAPECRDAGQQKMLPLNNLAQFIARLEGNEPAWISVRTVAYLIQTKIDVFKKTVFRIVDIRGCQRSVTAAGLYAAA
ncbi:MULTISPECIES: hypothetical protein [unclassified Acinetobacter]|uniref:hypothetical protein n=1 Tax=unclassified Acinetobacter TaxID=196816 RepID=UPI0020B2FBD8|nr:MULTISPECIES: hypothetical protein [unclassified Acinetobacter]